MPPELLDDYVKQCVQVKDVDSKSRRIKGFISVEEVDRDNEMVMADSLAQVMPRAMKVMSVVYLHQYGGAIGHPLEWAKATDSNGLPGIHTVTQIGNGYKVPTFYGLYEVDDIFAQVEQGHLRAHSIGFKAKREVPAEGDNSPIKLFVTDLYEYSLVVVPSCRGAVIEEVLKSAGLVSQCEGCHEKIHRQEQVAKLDLSELAKLLDDTRERLRAPDGPDASKLFDLLTETKSAIAALT